MKRRVMSIFLIFGLILSLLANVSPVKAEDPFPSPDIDGDGILNDMETSGWYNLSGGPYVTDRQDIDSDNDGLTDGEEKLFDTNPLDSHSPGIGVRYESSFKTKQYFSTTDPAYLSMKQGGDQYLLTEALVARRGTTFNIVGPAAGTLAITGAGLTALTGIPDPARGGWNVTLPAAGTAGAYTATITDGAWSISMPLYVIFELPATLPADQVAAFLYDDDPANKKDEVAVFWSMQEWKNWFNCPQPNDGICSDWAYHVATGYAQAFWTEQFTKSVFVNNAILAINGKTTPANAAAAVAAWTDTEFRTRSGKVKNSWSTAMNRWNDGTGITMDGGYCETTSTVFTTVLRSAGIAARPFTLDYNKTAGHGESGQIGTVYEYDHSVMMWLDGVWKAQRAYNGDEASDVYYPYAHGTTGIAKLSDWRTYTGYYSDYYGDTIVAVGAGWDFQNGNNGGGVVNTIWPMTVDQRLTVNQDFYWKSNWPLQITQSPYVDVLNCQLWKGDNWAPSEWSTPPTSNPAGRTAIQSYNLPAGIPDTAAPLENWPYNPRPTACSASTPTDVCNAYKASWTTVCTPLQGQSSDSVSNKSRSDFQVYLPVMDSGGWASGNIVLGDILESRGVDQNGDGRFEELAVKFDVDSNLSGEFQFGGALLAGESGFNSAPAKVTLQNGKQSVEVFFDGQQIRDNAVDGPYQVTALWAAPADQPIPQMIKPENMLAYREYAYETGSFTANQFLNQEAVFGEEITHEGIDADGNGLFESVAIQIPLTVIVPGSYTVEGDLYDVQGNFIGHESWSGEDAAASLQFNVAKFQPPFTLEHLNLIQSQGQIIDSRFYAAYQVTDMAGKVETSTVVLGEANQSEIDPQGVTPNTFTFNPVDTDSDGLFDKLVVNVGVTVTDHGGSYKIEGLLVDEYGTKVAWAVSNAQALVVGSQTMTLDFDGKMLYDQLPLSGTRSFKLVAVKIFSGNLSSATLESEAKSAGTTAAYARSQFEASSSAAKLFEDDMNSGGGKWAYTQPIWGLTGAIWNSGPQTWMASISGSSSGQLTTSTALDFTNYADPVLRFDHAYKMTGAGDTGVLQASTDGGTTWTTIKTYTGATTHWMTELVSLSAYSGMPNVKLRFNAQATSNLLWYVDDVFINAWPAVTGASFTYSSPVAGANTTLTASYTSIDTTLPVTYKWDFCGVEQTVSTSTITYAFPNAGNCAVTLTVSNPYDSAVTSQTVYVAPGSGQYTLTVNIPGGGGTVAKSPDRPAYNPGEVVTLTQTTSTGYTWGGWSGACTGTGACTVTMDANKTVTANFTPIEYSLNITVTGTGSVTKSPDQATYHYGDTVQLTAVPGEHWAFSGWGGDLTGSTSPTPITINGNKSVTALFVQSDFTLTATTVGSGTVVKNPDLAYYHVGQEVSVTAAPAAGWSFASWSGDLTGSTNPGSIIMNSSKAVTATFTQDQYTLNVTVTGSGTVAKSPQQDTYTYGTAVTLTPTPATGWSFAGWTGACSGTGACVVTMTGNTSVGATFTENHYTLTTTVVGQGAVAKSPDQGTYTHGQVVTLTATPVTGWSFSGWSGACSGTGTCELTMDGNKSVTATFTRIEYTLTLTMVGHGQLTANRDAPYYYGDTVILTAAATSGWTFEGFSGDVSGTTSPVSITIDGNKSVTATFTEDWYTLTVEIDGHGTVGVNPVGPYRWHAMPVLTAYPDPGWTFVSWTGERVGTANPIEVTVNNNGVETAHFTPIPYTFTTSVVGSGTLSKSPDQTTYIYGDAVTVTAAPAAGWSFDHWSGSCTGNGPCVVTVDGNESVEATFVPGANTLDVTVVGSGTVTKTPDQGTYPTGAAVSLSATPETGWEFAGWSGDVTSTDNPLTVTMDANKAITATFAQTVFDLSITAENGTVSVDPVGPYTYNTAVTLTAAPNDGYTFAGWSGDLTGTDNPAVVNMTTDKNITAGFAAIPCYVPRLVAQIEAANADPDATTIDLDGDCTYELTAVYAADPDGYGPVGLPPITTPVTLAGSNSTIARNATAAFRLLYVTSTGSLTIEDVTLSNGLAKGGNGGHAQYDAGGAGAGMGGAIFNRGALTLTDVTFIANSAVGGNGGNDNTVAIPADGGGGGMGGDGANAPGNNLGGAGGGLYGGTGGIAGSNSGKAGGVGGGGGGAAYSGGHGSGGAGGFGGGGGGGSTGGAGGFGGGGGGGQTAAGAGAGGFGGGRGQDWVGGGGAGFGGAIFNDQGTLILTNTTFSGNLAIGGNGTLGSGGIESPTGTGGGGSGYGGAVFNHLGTYSITNASYDNNSVVAGTGGPVGRAVVADFYDWVQYTLTTSTTGTGSITLSSAGPYYNMDAVTLTAVPGTGYSFSEWTGDLSGATNPVSITLDGNKTVGATFTANPVTLTINQPAAGGTITADPAGPYHYGDVVTVSLALDTGYDFTGWTGDLSGTTNPATLTLNGDKTVSASLALQTVTLTIGTPAGGTITASPEGPYVYGQEVTLTAEPATGYDFTGWTGDLSGTTSPATITLLGDKTVGANFELQTVTLTVEPATGGEIQVTPGGTYHYGDVVTVEAVAGTGYDFTGWTGDLSGTTDNPATLTLNGSKTIGATFGLETVTLTISDLTGGTITMTPAGPYLYGNVVEVEAVANLGHSFTGWTGDLSGTTNPTNITLDGSKTIGATFDLNVVNLTITQAEGGTITATSEGPYHYGDSVTLQAAADTGYDFVDWTGILSGAGNPATITLYNDVAVSAIFARQPVTLAIGTPVGGAISATPAGPYLYGAVVTVEATPEAGYTFTGWTGDLSGTTNPTTITLDGSKSIDATFELNVVTLTMSPMTGGTVNVTPVGTHHYGDTVTLEAVAVEGHTFTGWTGDCSGTELTCVLLMNGDKTVGATFTANPVTLTITQPAAGGSITVDPAEPYHYGDVVTVSLAMDTGYDFTGWTGDLSGTTNPATLTLNGDKSVSASLTLQTVVLTIETPVGGTITADLAEPYHYGQTVVLTAAATPGYDFSGWTGDCSGGELTCSLLMNGDKTVGATFTLRPNTAPVLNAIGDQAAMASNPLTFNAAASDGDDPAQTLTYALDAGAPSGAVIDPATGVFTWTPTAVQALASYTITVTVTDSGTPALSDSETITIDVAEWSENWEGYALGTVMHNVNNWAGWGGDVNAAGTVSDGQSLSAPQSVVVQGTADQVHTYVGATSGKWVYTTWQYIPVDITGSPYFVMLNEYPYTTNGSWSVQVLFDTSTNTVGNQIVGGGTLPLVKGRWVKLVEEIDLDQDIQRFYYDGKLLYQAPWSTAFGTGIKNIGAVDLYAQNSSAVYYDNLSLNRAQTLTTSVTGSGEITRSPNQTFYALNDVVELTAVPAAGWHFVEWTGACTGSGACSVTMDGDKTVSATFAIDTYTLTVDQPGHGAIDPVTATYDYGTVVTLTATPETGYHLVGWTGDCSGTELTCDVTVDGNKTVSATFAINTYTLTVEQPVHGAIDPVTNTYDYGTSVTLTVTPETGYHLVEWTGACTGDGACSVTMDGDKTVGATLAINTYTLTVNQPVHGAITPATANYEYGTVVTLTATPETGYHLVGWTGDCSGTQLTCDVTVDGSKTVSATFAINTYTLTVEQSLHGAITPATASYEYGTVVTLTATPETGYHLVGWTGDCSGTQLTCDVTVDGSKTVSATFAINTYTLTVEQPEHGMIAPATATYEYGTLVTLTATPEDGYHLVAWIGACTGDGACSVTMDDNKTVSATFEIDTFIVTASAGTGGSIDPSGAVTVAFGADQAFSITANPGSHVVDVLVDGVSVGAVTSYTFSAVAANHTIAASFEIDTFTITASAGTGGSISPEGAVTVDYGADQTFTISPTTGYHVADVLVDGVSVGAVTSYTFSAVDANHTIVASFEIDTFTITASAGTGGSIDPSGALTVDYNADQSFTISPTTGYHVADILVDGASVGAVETYTFSNVTANHTIEVSFAINTFMISASAGTGGSISPDGMVPLAYGADQTFSIVANPGYHVLDVLVDGASVGAVTSYTFSAVTGDHTIAASFAINTYTINASAGTGGSIDPSGGVTVEHGAVQTFNITTDPGYKVFDVLVDGASVGAVTSYTFSNVTTNHTIAASFTQEEYALSITQATGGTITADPAGPYHLNDTVTVTAVPDENWSLTAWTGDCAGQGNPCTLTMDGIKTVSAVFTPTEYTEVYHLTASQYGNGTLSLTITATPDAGWMFKEWRGDCQGEESPVCTIVLDGDKEIIAIFMPATYTLTVGTSEVGSGTVTVDPEEAVYHYDEQVTLTAEANTASGYSFTGWTGDEDDLGQPMCDDASTTCTVTMRRNTEIIATFAGPAGQAQPSNQYVRSTQGSRETLVWVKKSTNNMAV